MHSGCKGPDSLNSLRGDLKNLPKIPSGRLKNVDTS